MTGRPAVLALLVLASVVFPADAEKPRSGAILPGVNSKEPVNIAAAKLDYLDKEQKLVYTGNVVATQGEQQAPGATRWLFSSRQRIPRHRPELRRRRARFAARKRWDR